MPNPQSMAEGAKRGTGIGLQRKTLHLVPGIFTDDTSTGGTYTWSDAMPDGCFYAGLAVEVITGFLEDTSCVLKAGKTDTEDEFTNGSTVNIFTGGVTVGSEGEDPMEWLGGDTTDVYVEITSGSDITDVLAGDGEAYLYLYYFEVL